MTCSFFLVRILAYVTLLCHSFSLLYIFFCWYVILDELDHRLLSFLKWCKKSLLDVWESWYGFLYVWYGCSTFY